MQGFNDAHNETGSFEPQSCVAIQGTPPWEDNTRSNTPELRRIRCPMSAAGWTRSQRPNPYSFGGGDTTYEMNIPINNTVYEPCSRLGWPQHPGGLVPAPC